MVSKVQAAPVMVAEGEITGVTIPNDKDVLCGRGGGAHRHPGNVLYREFVNSNKRQYMSCRKAEKVKISQSIVAAIREEGGRFLDRKSKSAPYFDIGDKKAVEKTSQALREGQGELMKMIKNEATASAPDSAVPFEELMKIINNEASAPAPDSAAPLPSNAESMPADMNTANSSKGTSDDVDNPLAGHRTSDGSISAEKLPGIMSDVPIGFNRPLPGISGRRRVSDTRSSVEEDQKESSQRQEQIKQPKRLSLFSRGSDAQSNDHNNNGGNRRNSLFSQFLDRSGTSCNNPVQGNGNHQPVYKRKSQKELSLEVPMDQSQFPMRRLQQELEPSKFPDSHQLMRQQLQRQQLQQQQLQQQQLQNNNIQDPLIYGNMNQESCGGLAASTNDLEYSTNGVHRASSHFTKSLPADFRSLQTVEPNQVNQSLPYIHGTNQQQCNAGVSDYEAIDTQKMPPPASAMMGSHDPGTLLFQDNALNANDALSISNALLNNMDSFGGSDCSGAYVSGSGPHYNLPRPQSASSAMQVHDPGTLITGILPLNDVVGGEGSQNTGSSSTGCSGINASFMSDFSMMSIQGGSQKSMDTDSSSSAKAEAAKVEAAAQLFAGNDLRASFAKSKFCRPSRRKERASGQNAAGPNSSSSSSSHYSLGGLGSGLTTIMQSSGSRMTAIPDDMPAVCEVGSNMTIGSTFSSLPSLPQGADSNRKMRATDSPK